MSDYQHSDDGKLHTRYSELVRCTPGQIDRVLAERMEGFRRFESDDMEFGTLRHDMWRTEALETAQTAECFGLQFPATHIETEFAVEILPGVVLHSRPDAVSVPAEAVIDYKTLVASSLADGIIKAHTAYAKSKQLPVYAFQLGINGIRVRRLVYLIEVWDRERETILGYTPIEKRVNMGDVARVIPWINERVSMLAAALESRVGA